MSTPKTLAGRYELRRLLGKGGMGEVHLAQDLMIDRLVAIKFVAGVEQKRFLREARAVGRLDHPNIVTIFDVGTDGDRQFLAMEYIEGDPLDTIIAERRAIPLTTRVQIIEQLCEGLAAAHRAGVVHLDIKPSNLILKPDGRLKIVDFGIATATDVSVTFTTSVAGSLPYMAPEQLAGEATTARTDVFSTTVVAYELLTYSRAYPGGANSAARRLVDTSVIPVSQMLSGLGDQADRLIGGGLSRDPLRRPVDMEDLGRQFAALRQSMLDTELPPTLFQKPARVGVASSSGSVLLGSADADADTPLDEPAKGPTWWPRAAAGAAVIVTASVAWMLTQGPDPVTTPQGPPAGPVTPQQTGPGTQTPPPQTSRQNAPPRGARREQSNAGQPAAPQAIESAPNQTEASTDLPTGGPNTPPPVAQTPDPVVAGPPTPVEPAPETRPSTADDEQAIRRLIEQFATAHASRSTPALKMLYPSLTGPEMASLERTFLTASDYQLVLSDVSVQVQGDQAKVVARASKRIVPLSGEPKSISGPASFELMRGADGWMILRAQVP